MFKPTYLYVKTHNQTGLKYFGKTTSADPHKYKGSGVYWARHIKQHGNDVATTITGYYDDEVKCRAAADKFCKENQIVESPEWANLKLETLEGGFDHIHSKGISSEYMKDRWKSHEYRAEMSQMSKGIWDDNRHKKMISDRERYWTDDAKKNMSLKMKGNKNSLGVKQQPRVYVTNGVDTRGIPPDTLEDFLTANEGWRQGMTKSYPSTRKPRQKKITPE